MRRAIPFCVSLVLLVFCSLSYSQDDVATDTPVIDTPVIDTPVIDSATDTLDDTGTVDVVEDVPNDVSGSVPEDTDGLVTDVVTDEVTDEATDPAAGSSTDKSASIDPLHPPIKALILTSPGVYHNYEQQTWDIGHGIVERANVRFDVSLAEPERWKTTDFSEGYDVLIYNICMADNQDPELIANMRRQTEVLGVPAVFIHCTMHSFRETDLWWPFVGLRTKAHEPLRALRQVQSGPHPILTGIPEDWVLPEDELYINLDFAGQSLLSAVGEDGKPHTTAWIDYRGLTPIFGTTLGHSEDTMKNTAYQQLLANAVLFVTGNLSSDGKPAEGMGAVGDGMDIFGNFSAPEGVKFLGRDGMDCVSHKLVIAAAPCYIACTLNPLEWGEETQACKAACDTKLPSSDELIKACSPKT